MSRRQTNRKVTIRFSGNEPTDPQRSMDVVEAAFRPNQIEVEVDSRGMVGSGQRIANEALASSLIPAVKAVLKEAAEVNAPAPAPAIVTAKARSWVRRYWAAGWAIIVSAAAVGANIKKILFMRSGFTVNCS